MDYEKLLEMRNTKNPFMQYAGIRVTRITEGYAEGELAVCEDHLNPLGTVHGGCLYTMADSVAGAAAVSYGRYAVTVSGDLHYLSPAKGEGRLYAFAEACKHGKTIPVFDVRIESSEGVVLARGIFTFYLLDRPIVF